MGDDREEETEDRQLHSCFMTFEADEDTRDLFYVVIGSIVENFRGVKLVEFDDDTAFAEGSRNAMARLHEMVTSGRQLTPTQREALDEFGRQLAEWDGGTES